MFRKFFILAAIVAIYWFVIDLVREYVLPAVWAWQQIWEELP